MGRRMRPIEGPDRYKVMMLPVHDFIRRFLMHVLPAGFHRIRYYGLLASGKRADNIARARKLLAAPLLPTEAIKAAGSDANQPHAPKHPCPCCGGPMIIIETFARGCSPQHRPTAPMIRIDTSRARALVHPTPMLMLPAAHSPAAAEYGQQ